MYKTLNVLAVSILLAGMSFAGGGGRWSVTKEKLTGKNIAHLQTESKKVLKVVPLDPVRVYSPVSYDDISDTKQKKTALREGFRFTRLTAKNVSATPVDGGRLLVLQEQTIIMPPQREGAPSDFTKKTTATGQEPAENNIVITLFDESGTALWSRKVGPIAGHLPADRAYWSSPASLEPARPDTPGQNQEK